MTNKIFTIGTARRAFRDGIDPETVAPPRGYQRQVFFDEWERLQDDPEQESCPSCGYRIVDAKLHGDHRICSNYPFFEWEKK